MHLPPAGTTLNRTFKGTEYQGARSRKGAAGYGVTGAAGAAATAGGHQDATLA